jgi:tRNA splicing ligase
MLEVQKFLENASANKQDGLALLNSTLGINHIKHENEPLVILNYDIIESPKTHPIVCECRGLVLEQDTWKVVARSFPRFFNHEEALGETAGFDWTNFSCSTKEDGSLILLYYYRDRWHVNTRGSFGQGEVNSCGRSWEELFYSVVDETGMDYLPSKCTLVFELVGPFNKIVREYKQTDLFLLTAFRNEHGSECFLDEIEFWAKCLRVKQPKSYQCTGLSDVQHLFNERSDDLTFEGFVLRDKTGLRMKMKSKTYVALHRMKGNNGQNLASPKNLVPLILAGEADEVISYFPEVKEHVRNCQLKIQEEYVKLRNVPGRMLITMVARKISHCRYRVKVN